jgi:hypothetical protein
MGEIMKAGRKPQIIEIVIIAPDLVVNVMNHVIAYWTKDEPKSDIVWLPINRNTFFFQSIAVFIGILLDLLYKCAVTSEKAQNTPSPVTG